MNLELFVNRIFYLIRIKITSIYLIRIKITSNNRIIVYKYESIVLLIF